MSLADELLADLDDVGDDEKIVQENVQSDKTLQRRAEDSDTEMVNGEEEVGGGLVLEGNVDSRFGEEQGRQISLNRRYQTGRRTR
jgi:hypothetical protein